MESGQGKRTAKRTGSRGYFHLSRCNAPPPPHTHTSTCRVTLACRTVGGLNSALCTCLIHQALSIRSSQQSMDSRKRNSRISSWEKVGVTARIQRFQSTWGQGTKWVQASWKPEPVTGAREASQCARSFPTSSSSHFIRALTLPRDRESPLCSVTSQI